MALDELIYLEDTTNANIGLLVIKLNYDKDINLLQAVETQEGSKKKYLRGALILVEKDIITSVFPDTLEFALELKVFDKGNSQNKYFSIVEHKKVKNLLLAREGKENIYISKIEAMAMYQIFQYSLWGYSSVPLVADSFEFTPDILAKALHKSGLLERK